MMQNFERDMMLLWIRMIEKGGSVLDFFKRNRIERIAIYCAGTIGLKLYSDIRGSSVEIRAIIDKSNRYIDGSLEVSSPDRIDEIDFSDCVVVIASVSYYPEVHRSLREKVGSNLKIIGIEDIVLDELLSAEGGTI